MQELSNCCDGRPWLKGDLNFKLQVSNNDINISQPKIF